MAKLVCKTGWWFLATPLKNINVNWDDERNPILMGKFKKWQPNHQPEIVALLRMTWDSLNLDSHIPILSLPIPCRSLHSAVLVSESTLILLSSVKREWQDMTRTSVRLIRWKGDNSTLPSYTTNSFRVWLKKNQRTHMTKKIGPKTARSCFKQAGSWETSKDPFPDFISWNLIIAI